MANKKGPGGSSRKVGRTKDKCKSYKAAGRREKNKAKKIKRHLKQQPNDQQAKLMLGNLHPRVKSGKRNQQA